MASGAGSAERISTRHNASAARTGLLGFDLGRIPAPVTPPRSSKHAGWFAAASSMIAGATLALLTSTLVGPPLAFRTVEALPGLPGLRLDGAAPLPDLTWSTSTRPSAGAGDHTTGPSLTSAPAPSGTPGAPIVPVTNGVLPEVQPTAHSRPGAGRPTPTSTKPAQGAKPAGPIRETRPAEAVPAFMAAGVQPSDPDLMGDRAEAFYRLLTTNPAAAYEMTTGELRGGGAADFRRQYSNMVGIEIKKLLVSPAEGTVASLVVVTYHTGAKVTENRVVTYSGGDNPLISSEHIR